MADQARMPYTNAVIHEVQRFGDIAPLNLPRITSRDIEVQDFLIPKVGLGLLLLHHDHYPTRAEETNISTSNS
jgi:cytochrome P450